MGFPRAGGREAPGHKVRKRGCRDVVVRYLRTVFAGAVTECHSRQRGQDAGSKVPDIPQAPLHTETMLIFTLLPHRDLKDKEMGWIIQLDHWEKCFPYRLFYLILK